MNFLIGADRAAGDIVNLKATHRNHFGIGTEEQKPRGMGAEFSDVLLNAVNETSGLQNDMSDITRAYLTDPDSVDAHDVTIAISKANMSLEITKAVVDGALKAYNNIINVR